MDFWSKLIGGAGTSAPSRHARPNQPQQRLNQFKTACFQLQQSWQRWKGDRPDPSAAGTLCLHLQTINRILGDESHAAAPHTCVQYVATTRLYVLVSSLGLTARNDQIAKEAIRFYNLLIDREDEDFIEDTEFADKLNELARGISHTSGVLTIETRTELVESLFAVTAKLRQRSSIPSAWFRPRDPTQDTLSASADLPLSQHQEFLLVFILLDYVHYDGKIGDFARTGILYILESASRSPVLERWVIESEISTVLASGLGALYSQLSSKVALFYSKDSMPQILAFSNVAEPDLPHDAEPIFSTDLQTNLSTFVTYLSFWQDILERCPSVDIKASLLDHFDFLFLRPLLYPSIVESSDVDNGSSVAVMTYLRYILENIDQVDIIRLLLRYMLGAPIELTQDTKPARPSALARRRKSESLISISAARPDNPSPDLLTLSNVLHGYLSSRNQQTVTASLRLLGTILRSWHGMASTTLFQVGQLSSLSTKRTLDVEEKGLDFLYFMAEEILDDDDMGTYYESYLRDAEVAVETHPCSASQLFPSHASPVDEVVKDGSTKTLQARQIIPDDPLLVSLVSLLDNFLVNDIEVNLSLSETLAAVASCSAIKLESWLLPSKFDDSVPIADTDDGRDAADLSADRSTTVSSSAAPSPVFNSLDSLVKRIDNLRQEIQDLDIHLAERRHVFKVGKEIDDATSEAATTQKSRPQETRPLSNVHGHVPVGSIAERLKESRDVSRSSSPRGRQERQHPQAKSLVGRLAHLRLSPSPSPSKTSERPYSPSPLRRNSLSSANSSALPSPRGPADALHRKIRLKVQGGSRRPVRDNAESEASSVHSETVLCDAESVEETREVGLSHLLTNIIILQEFILELAAIIHIRASLFGEVSLS